MYKLIILIFILSPCLHANTNANLQTFWKSCPKAKDSVYRKLNTFDSMVQSHFDKKATSSLVEIYSSEGFNADLLRYFAPYLLPAGSLAEFDKACWAIYQDSLHYASEKDFAKADEKLTAWGSCIETNYKKIPIIVNQILRCIK